VPAYVQLALTYQNQYVADPVTFSGRLADAIDCPRARRGLRAHRRDVQNTKGIIYYEAGDLAQARTTLERAVELAAATACRSASARSSRSTSARPTATSVSSTLAQSGLPARRGPRPRQRLGPQQPRAT
jgi:hypothetical protein